MTNHEQLFANKQSLMDNLTGLIRKIDDLYKRETLEYLEDALVDHTDTIQSLVRMTQLLTVALDFDFPEDGPTTKRDMIADNLMPYQISQLQERLSAAGAGVGTLREDIDTLAEFDTLLNKKGIHLVTVDTAYVDVAEADSYVHDPLIGWVVLLPLPKVDGKLLPIGINIDPLLPHAPEEVEKGRIIKGVQLRLPFVDALIALEDADLPDIGESSKLH